MKKLLFISIVLIFLFKNSFAETFISVLNHNKQYSVVNNKTESIFADFEIKEAKYSTFDGRSADVYIIVGKNVVLNIDKNEIDGTQLKDTLTLQKILNRCDSLYQYYKDNLGYEPPGGNILFNNKANIYFGAPSCGSGCGLVGAKGIEVSGFKNIFFNIKYKINVNRDVIIGYEFGRNFFDFSNKILFPYDLSKNEKNGGFAESFANVFYTYAFDKILTSNEERVFNETLLNPQWAYSRFIGYISDTVATPFNTISKQDLIGIRDPNRGFDGWNCETPSWDSYALLEGIIRTIGRDKLFPKFFNEIKKMPDVLTKEDAMSNIALAASYAANQNLNAFFKNVIKFKLNKNVEDKINSLPLVQSKLIKYEPKLWFITPFHTIRLNLRSTNYIADNLNYKIYAGDSLISNSKNGNNEIKYQILNGRNDINLLCLLTNDENKIIDSFSTQILKRHNVNLFEDTNGWYAYYLSNLSTKSYINENKEYVLVNLSDTLEDQGLLFYNLVVPKGRKLNINGEIRNVSKYTPGVVSNFSGSGYSSPVMSGGDALRIGYDIGQNDSSSFYKISNRSGITDLYMCENRDLFMLRINLNNLGRGVKSYFKNFILRDETDSDMDGLVDFEDPCPISTSTKPTFNTSKYSFCTGDSLKLSVTNVNKGDTLKWYYGSKTDFTNTLNLYFNDSSSRVYVTRTDSLGCVISSDTINIVKNLLPSSPIIGENTFCQNSDGVLKATATSGNNLLWYGTNAIGGAASSTATTLRTADTTTKYYYVSQQNTTSSCESLRAKITVKINPIPSSPIVRDTAYCHNSSVDTLRALNTTGNSLVWYGTNASGGEGSTLGNIPNTKTAGTLSYYVSQKNISTGCEGTRAKINVTINPLPTAPLVRDTAYCQNGTADTIRITPSSGSTILWYGNSETGGTASSVAPKPSTTSVGNVLYYMSQKIAATGCEGSRAKVIVTTKPIPNAPTIARDTSNNLAANTNGITWYKDGVKLSDTTQKFKPTSNGSYTATTTQNGCTSAISSSYYYLTTSISNLSNDEYFRISPNPTDGEVYLNYHIRSTKDIYINIIDVNGRNIISNRKVNNSSQLNLGSSMKGNYIIQVKDKTGKLLTTEKLIKN